ncbi:hypothetical protein GCM10029992_04240 [Glycomyces albus]
MDIGANHTSKITLSEEEIRIIDYLYGGMTQKAIGRRLGVEDRTVRRRLDELKAKLRAGNSLQIPVKAHRCGIWSPPE